MASTLELAVKQIGEAARSLGRSLITASTRRELVASVGWLLPPGVADVDLSALAVEPVVTKLDTLLESTDAERSDSTLMAQRIADALSAVVTFVSGVAGVVSAFESFPPTYLQTTNIVNELPGRLINLLLFEQLRVALPRTFAILQLAGLIEIDVFQADTTIFQSDHQRYQVRFDRLKDIVDPNGSWAAEVYEWGTATPDLQGLVSNIGDVVRAFGGRVLVDNLERAAEEIVLQRSVPEADTDPMPVALSELFRAVAPDTGQGGLSLMGLRAGSAGATDAGLALTPYAYGSANLSFPLFLSEQDDWEFLLDAGGQLLAGGILLMLRPNQPMTIQTNVFDPSTRGTAASATVSVGVSVQRTGGKVPLISLEGGTVLEAESIVLKVGAEVGGSGGGAFGDLEINKGHLVIGLGDADGFLSSLFGGTPPEANFDIGVQFSQNGGLHFKGSGSFEVALPVTITIGRLHISGVTLAITADTGGIVVNASVDASASLGPVNASVEEIGVGTTLKFQNGNLGPLDLGIAFKAPTGVGLAVDAGSVHGGGFISLDPTAGRYFGGLQLSIYDISVSAFALIETKVPNVDFSFVIVISAQFTPIQLGFGFTLNGVGGMIGINRSIDTNALASLVRAGQSEELLFPKNVISDAPTIVKDLTTVFPATQGKYVFGPLGKLGWGTPTLITGEIGIILEYPALVVVLLGEVKCLLPKPDQALVKLNLSIDGVLDFPNKTFSMDADLHDSVINGFPVSGQMAMRVSWGDQPNFVFSIGGFHPAYTPPPNFPKLQPMTLDLGSHGPAKINVSGFFAVTSNTVQVGGTATLHAGGSGITLDASVSVKALFVFQPFSFEADIDASVSVSFHGYGIGVHLSGTLDGPSPWHIKGEVCVSVLWWDACLGFDETFGGATQITAPSVDPWLGAPSTDPTADIVGLQRALSDPGNWSGAHIPGTVSSVARVQGTDTLVDPVGGLTVRQKTAPVETPNPLTKFGVAKTTKPISFSKVQATLGTAPNNTVSLTAVEAVNEDFAPAQFFDMDDGKKLSSAGFEQYQAGYLFATADGKNAQGGSSVTFQPTTRTLVINSDGTDTEFDDNYAPTDPQVTAFNKQSAIAKGGLAQAGTRRFVNRAFAQSFSQVLPTFVITDTTTMAVPTTTTLPAPAAAVRSATLIALDAFRAQHVDLALGVQVTALHDMPT